MKKKYLQIIFHSIYILSSRPSNLKVFIVIIYVFSILQVACRKYVTVDPPVGQLTADKIFSTNSTAIQAMVSIYADMANSFNPVYLSGLSSDELTSYSTYINTLQYYENSLNESIISSNDLWQPYFRLIYQANAEIEGVANNESLTPAVSKQLSGEAKFVRAYCYFYLTNFFGDLPLVITTDYATNSKLGRISQALIYKNIIADLVDAEANLNEKYVDITDTALTTQRVRPNRYAAAALLARVYLYMGDYSNATVEATKVINNPDYSIETNLANVFLSSSKEAIWQLQPSVAGYNTVYGSNFILTGPPFGESTTLSNALLNSFEIGDARKYTWINSFVDTTIIPNVSYYYAYKYKINAASSVTESTIVFRLAEQYLIRAECLAQQGDISGALADLNIIHQRMGATKLQPIATTSKSELLKAILHERQVELFTEGCHRWFDLKRTNSADTIMPFITKLKGGVWSNIAKLYPIALAERLNDPNIGQNPGY